jgi:hypothetical protein
MWNVSGQEEVVATGLLRVQAQVVAVDIMDIGLSLPLRLVLQFPLLLGKVVPQTVTEQTALSDLSW